MVALALCAIPILLVSMDCCAALFTTKAIGQSNPLAGGANTITVTLVANAHLAAMDNSVVTILGLTNAVATTPIALSDRGDDCETIFSDGTTQGKGAWNSDTLTLNVHTGWTLTSGTTYTFAFQITNPSSAQASPAINIEASGTASFTSVSITALDANVY